MWLTEKFPQNLRKTGSAQSSENPEGNAVWFLQGQCFANMRIKNKGSRLQSKTLINRHKFESSQDTCMHMTQHKRDYLTETQQKQILLQKGEHWTEGGCHAKA
jgi:hypothetical protein